MDRKRKRQNTNAKLTIDQRKKAIELIEKLQDERHGSKPPSKVELSQRVGKMLKRPVSEKTISNLMKQKENILSQVDQPKRNGFYRLQSEAMVRWENQFDEYISYPLGIHRTSIL